MTDFGQAQFNQEIHERTVEALQHAKELGLPPDDLHLLCWHSGVNAELIERSQDGNRS